MSEPQVETTTGHVTDGGAWLLVLSSVFLCNLLKILLPSCSSIISRLLQKDAEQESEMRSEIQNMKQELSTISMMDEFARYARLERKINKMTDKLKTHVKTRTAQLAKIKWVINIVFYILQAALMISLIWKYYSEPVTVLPSKWLAPLERLVAFPTGVAAHLDQKGLKSKNSTRECSAEDNSCTDLHTPQRWVPAEGLSYTPGRNCIMLPPPCC
ncbi:guided entry of tail-anchored proteins factor 1 isoform X1 [Pogona vitticeps]